MQVQRQIDKHKAAGSVSQIRSQELAESPATFKQLVNSHSLPSSPCKRCNAKQSAPRLVVGGSLEVVHPVELHLFEATELTVGALSPEIHKQQRS